MNVVVQAEIAAGGDALGPRIALLVALAVAIGGLWIWWVFLGRKRLIQDVPTSKARGVALGLNELVGTVRSETTEPSPHAGVECVWWKNEIYVQDKDNGWRKTGDRHGGPIGFHLEDDSGVITVRPRHAEVSGTKVYDGAYDETLTLRDDPNPTLVTRYLAGQGSRSRGRVVEHVIRPGDPVYVLGTAQLPGDDLDVYIGPDRVGGEPFFVRVGSESDALFAERVGTVVGGLAAVAGAVAAGIAWADGQALAAGSVEWSEVGYHWPIAAASAVMAAMTVASLVFVYNGLRRLRQRAAAAWSLIDVQLHRRHDLVPNLVEVVQAHAGHERRVQTAVSELRSAMIAEIPAGPSNDAVRHADSAIHAEHVALHRALAVIEAYPTIRADASFARLRAELIDTENRVALARTFYNNSVLALHDRATTVVGGIVAWVFELDLDAEFLDDLGGTAAPVVVAQPKAPASRIAARRSSS